MPRYRTGDSSVTTAPVEFDLCARCAADGDIVLTVMHDKLGVTTLEGRSPNVDRIAHRSYDFQPRPTPCISCARILTSEDD